jgi:hypothetical protein
MIPRHLTIKDLGGSILAVTNARNIHRQLTEIALYSKLGTVPNFRNENEEANPVAAHSQDVQTTSRRNGSQNYSANLEAAS